MRISIIPMAWLGRLNPRERVLMLLVAGVLFVILNLMAIKFLLGAYEEVTRGYAEDRQEVVRLRVLADQRQMWVERNAWLKSTQPVLVNRDRAGTGLYEQIQALARARQVVLSALQIKPAVTTPVAAREAETPQVVSVEGDGQGDWGETVRFLAEVQKPENFLVFELATLRANAGDVKQLRCHFLISKWYAPAAK